jgi:CRISPR/Cas system-associated exonuclease Cas4 (RecB family)
MTKKIMTIGDLKNADPDDIEKIRSRINIAKIVRDQLVEDGQRTGLTMEAYEHHLTTRKERKTKCKTCYGKGYTLPYERSCGTIHASSAHYCRTRLYYDVIGDIAPKSRIDPSLAFTFQIGHALHETIQNALTNALGKRFHEEVKIDLPEAFVSGSSVDGVIEFDDCRVVLEIKSIGSKFTSLGSPLDYHRNQAMGIYATAVDAPFVSTLYVEKAWPHNFKEFVEVYDPKVYERWWRDKGSHVEKALEEDRPPLADSNKWECLDCPYGHECNQFIDPKTAQRRLR